MDQPSLFDNVNPIVHQGRVAIRQIHARSILSPANGSLAAYDFTLNPYTGCAFGCSYCYAAFFVADEERFETWGRWVDVKANALDLLRRAPKLPGAKLYIGSATDPYQPLERKTELTRSLLAFMVGLKPQPRIVIQTRSDLPLRDLDLLQRFDQLRVNVTVTTDSDAIRKRFEPACLSIERRLAALRSLKAAGIRTGASLSPLLPIRDPPAFAETIAALRTDKVTVSPFHANWGRFAAGTLAPALELAREYGWDTNAYARVVEVLRARLPTLNEPYAGIARDSKRRSE